MAKLILFLGRLVQDSFNFAGTILVTDHCNHKQSVGNAEGSEPEESIAAGQEQMDRFATSCKYRCEAVQLTEDGRGLEAKNRQRRTTKKTACKRSATRTRAKYLLLGIEKKL